MTALQPRKARPIPLAPGLTRRALAARALHEARQHFALNASALTRASDPELVHQARVGLRRLRVFVRMFREQLGKRRATRLSAELRWLFAKLGRARDLDVFASAVLPQLEAPPHSAALLATGLRRESAIRATELQAALRSTRFQALCQELASAEAALESGDARPKRARKWLARRLERRRERIVVAGEALEAGEAAALHELRKEVKKLRYASELAPGMFRPGPKRSRAYEHALKQLQASLGELNDLAVARRLVSRLVRAKPSRALLTKRIDRLRAGPAAALPRSLEHFERARPIWR